MLMLVTEGIILLVITQVSGGLKKLRKPRFWKYKYLHDKIASLAIVESYVTVSHFCE